MKKKLKKKIVKMIKKAILQERNRPIIIRYSRKEHLAKIIKSLEGHP